MFVSTILYVVPSGMQYNREGKILTFLNTEQNTILMDCSQNSKTKLEKAVSSSLSGLEDFCPINRMQIFWLPIGLYGYQNIRNVVEILKNINRLMKKLLEILIDKKRLLLYLTIFGEHFRGFCK